MRYLLACAYILLSGIGLPFALQSQDLIGKEYVILAGEITALQLLEDFFLLCVPFCALFFVLQALMLLLAPIRTNRRLCRHITAWSLALAGFASASFSLTDHAQVYGNTWAPMETFMAFVIPVWPVILIIIVVGAYLGARLEKEDGMQA